MTGSEAIDKLALLGVRISLTDGELRAGPRHAITDDARVIITENREALIWALNGFPDARNVPSKADDSSAPRPSSLQGPECSGCDQLVMREEPEQGTRRRFFWRCKAGHAILEARRYGGRILLAPDDCSSFRPWQPGSQ